MALDETKVAALKATHGDNLNVTSWGAEQVVFKKPTRQQFTRFRDSIVKGETVQGGATLLRDVVVHPPWEEFVQILDREPGREDEITREVSKVAKSEEKLTTKKL